MPANSVGAGIDKLRRAIGVRAVRRAAVAGVVLPVGDSLDTLLPTAIYIALVSLVDESLEEFIDAKYPGAGQKDLFARIEFLASKSELNDPTGWHAIRLKRNSFAHDSSSFASWSDVEGLFQATEEELNHLGILKRKVRTSVT